jgi:hypothetical protein
MRYLRIRSLSSTNKDASLSSLALGHLTGDDETVKRSTPLTERVRTVNESEVQKNTETELQKEMLLLEEERIKHKQLGEMLNQLRSLGKKLEDQDEKETPLEYVHRLSGPPENSRHYSASLFFSSSYSYGLLYPSVECVRFLL